MVRVLHYIGGLGFGGSQMFVMGLYRNIDREKVQFDFVVFENQLEGFQKEIIKMGGKIYKCPRYQGKNHIAFQKWWKTFFQKHQEYPIFHCHVRSTASLCIHTAKKYGIIVIAHSHSISNGSGFRGKIKDIMQIPVRWQADYLFACSEKAGRWMYGRAAVKRNNYRVIFNAIDTKRFQYNKEKRMKVRKSLKIDKQYVIGTVGRLTEAKNQKFLIDLFADIHKKNAETILLIVGDGELRGVLEQQVKNLGLSDHVIFTGNKSNTQDYYQAMDVFVFPSLWEGLGISVIEAQCCGLPCIVSERIPKEIDMKAKLVFIVNLRKKEEWVKQIQKQKGRERFSQVKALKKAGYDINCVTQWIQNFYSCLAGSINE